MPDIQLEINEKTYEVTVAENETLLWVLRERLHLTGSKFGCGTGDCGACKVLIDGRAENSCTVLAKNMAGRRITTIEGLGAGRRLHPVQQAFIDAGAIQCGYCTPGMVITAVALLRANPAPGQEEIAQAFDSNICRCTGYKKIQEAVLLAARRMRGEGEA